MVLSRTECCLMADRNTSFYLLSFVTDKWNHQLYCLADFELSGFEARMYLNVIRI